MATTASSRPASNGRACSAAFAKGDSGTLLSASLSPPVRASRKTATISGDCPDRLMPIVSAPALDRPDLGTVHGRRLDWRLAFMPGVRPFGEQDAPGAGVGGRGAAPCHPRCRLARAHEPQAACGCPRAASLPHRRARRPPRYVRCLCFARPPYSSCRDRHCPKCHGLAQARWVWARMRACSALSCRVHLVGRAALTRPAQQETRFRSAHCKGLTRERSHRIRLPAR